MIWKILFLLFLSQFKNCYGSDKNLYDLDNCPVQELNKETYQHALDKQKMIMIVFYAPWCGHCQKFAPEFMKAAKSLQENFQNSIKFGAVNCVTLRNLCQENEVKSYPTLRAFGFGREIDKEFKESDAHSISSLNKFLEKYENAILSKSSPKSLKGPPSGLRDRNNSNSNPPNGRSGEFLPIIEQSDEENRLWRQRAVYALARSSSSVDRLHDALVSLRFLIEVDVMAQSLDHELKQTITILYQYLLPLLPEEPRILFRRYFDEIQSAGILSHERQGKTHLVVSDGIANRVFKDSLRNWRVCGVVGSNLPFSSPTTTKVTPTKPSRLIERETNQELFDGSKTGYTCGLWMLFHYLTVASEHTTQQENGSQVSTHDIMSLIRMIVEKLFHCRTCREHFLQMYDRCLYGRCDIGTTDYHRLQIWLWSVHNDATLRILNDHLPQDFNHSHKSPELELESLQSQIRWPGIGQCDHCFKEKSTSVTTSTALIKWPDVVVEYLQKSYWDSSWRIETPTQTFSQLLQQSQDKSETSASSSSSSSSTTSTSTTTAAIHILSSQASPLSLVIILFVFCFYAAEQLVETTTPLRDSINNIEDRNEEEEEEEEGEIVNKGSRGRDGSAHSSQVI